MPDEDKTFSGSLVLDLRIWWRHVHALYRPLQKSEKAGKKYGCFRLFEKLRYSNERQTKFERLDQEYMYLEENGKIVALQISPKIESLYGLGRQATKW